MKRSDAGASAKHKAGLAREKILKAAEAVFAEKGYYGARMDEIAARAGVNKAHVYYYFRGKQELLKELLRPNIAEAAALVGSTFDPGRAGDPEYFQGLVQGAFAFLSQKSNIIRILVLETLRSAAAGDLFAILDPLFSKVYESAAGAGNAGGETRLRALAEYFFLDISPLLMFFTLGGQFAAHYNLDETALAKAFGETYLRHALRYGDRIRKTLERKAESRQGPGVPAAE